MDAYRGTVVHCLEPKKMEVLSDYVVGVEERQVESVHVHSLTCILRVK